MTSSRRYAAYTVFRGKTPGVYQSWEECKEQIGDNPKSKYVGYASLYDAQLAWADWQKKLAAKLGSSTFLQQTTARPTMQALPQKRMNRPSVRTFDPPTVAAPPRHFKKIANPPSSSPIPDFRPSERYQLNNTPPPSSPLYPDLKRSAMYMDDSDNELEHHKRYRTSSMDPTPIPVLSREEQFELAQLEKQNGPGQARVGEGKINLTPEQDKVVNLALRKTNNIFITGAAGSGKTVTLKEILARIRKRKKGGKVEVVAPTGIAALPLDGKTTYSFAGWHPDSFRNGINKLLQETRPAIYKTINELDALVIEEISMVENQFLERLNLLFQHVLKNNRPFGGKQVIILGDFHQLPPVKPFGNCLQCGQIIPQKEVLKCTSPKCIKQSTTFTSSDKWAFKSNVWQELKLRHIKLEQIHRQKDTDFQDILNKIRHGEILSADEWNQLERSKELPQGAYPVRLMSRVAQVQAFNEQKLAELKSQPRSWKAYDHAAKLTAGNPIKADEYRNTLKDHRFPTDLTLKVGARVVLVHNLDQKRGLVNGSQGVVIGFAPSPGELQKIADIKGTHEQYKQYGIHCFQMANTPMRPLVRFANGATELITAIPQSAMRGDPLDSQQQYVVTRTQVPLILAWALSIHKSQGMTLEYVEVSSRDIFETGQLYVALSRATHLGGLKVTGFKRDQLPMDQDVMRFYGETKWEKLERPQKMEKNQSAVIDLT